MKHEVLTSVLVLVLSLTACGGGSSNDDWAKSDPSARAISTSSFDIQAAWTALNNAPNSSQLTVSGSCSGTYILSNSMAVQSSLPTVVQNIVTVNRAYGAYVPCASPFENKSSVEKTDTYYFYVENNQQYQNYYAYDGAFVYSWRLPYAKFPNTSKVGDTGLIGIINKKYGYAQVGVQEWSYVIEEDTAYSVIFNLVVKHYTTTNTNYQSTPVNTTEQFRYLVSQSNQMRLIKYDRVDADGFTIYGRLN